MPKSNTALPHTAIPSWSGFIYQGKVAIYHVLTLLERPNECEGNSLQLDSLEDFSILDAAGTPKSMHQVKAKISQRYSSYSKAFGDAVDGAATKCDKLFFHLAKEITDQTVKCIENTHDPLKVYSYGHDTWCSVEEIDEKINYQLIVLADSPTKKSVEYVCRAREALDQIVTKQVLKIHSMNHGGVPANEAAYSQKIDFSEFQAVLNRDVTEDGKDDDYYFYKLLIDLNRYYQGYCIDNEERPNWSDEIAQKLSLYMKEIGELDTKNMVLFIQNIMPHREVKFNTLSEYKDNTLVKDEIKDAFFSILSTLKKADLSARNFFIWNSNGSTYSPTTINAGSSHSAAISERIIENAKNNATVLFEGNNLITTDINVHSISLEAPSAIPDINDNSDNITKYKTISLVKLDDLTGEIND